MRSLQDRESTTMTYDKTAVLKAANKTAQDCRAARKRLLAEYDAQLPVYRFFSAFMGPGRPSYHRVEEQKTAERISFKATFCNEDRIELNDHEIDTIRDWWLVGETS
jgi:hypothetical protein